MDIYIIKFLNGMLNNEFLNATNYRRIEQEAVNNCVF